MKQGKVLMVALMITLLTACVAVQPVTNEPAASGQQTDEHEHTMDSSAELGTVDFPISCTAEAQAEFNHGMALLHSFWFGPAKKSFNTVAELDPNCAMAHWGVAMVLLGNPFSWPLTGQPLVDG